MKNYITYLRFCAVAIAVMFSSLSASAETGFAADERRAKDFQALAGKWQAATLTYEVNSSGYVKYLAQSSGHYHYTQGVLKEETPGVYAAVIKRELGHSTDVTLINLKFNINGTFTVVSGATTKEGTKTK